MTDQQVTKEAVVKQSETVERREVPAGKATQVQVLVGPEDGAPHFIMRRFIMGERGGIPKHTNTVEHEQYVLQGCARIVIADRTYEVRSGDVLYIPAGAPHNYEVLEAPFEFLCMVPNSPDSLHIVEEDSPTLC